MTTTATAANRLDLPIEGMTCASCATRVERRLNRLDGVQATVNYATEEAAVTFDAATVTPEQLLGAVEAAGYTARLPRAAGEPAAEAAETRGDPTRALRNRLIASTILTLPVLAMAMIPALQFDSWQWLALQLATPVVLLGRLAVPPRRVAEPPPRRRHDGHPDQRRHAVRLGLVDGRAVLPRRGRPRRCGCRSS